MMEAKQCEADSPFPCPAVPPAHHNKWLINKRTQQFCSMSENIDHPWSDVTCLLLRFWWQGNGQLLFDRSMPARLRYQQVILLNSVVQTQRLSFIYTYRILQTSCFAVDVTSYLASRFRVFSTQLQMPLPLVCSAIKVNSRSLGSAD